MLTFKELKELLDKAPKMERVPSRKELLTTGKVFVDRPIVNGAIIVFTNGFVLFRADDRCTVFSVHDCEEYVYSGSVTVVVPASDFDNADWSVRLVLEGEDRIQHSRENCDSDRGNISYSAITEDWKELADDTYDVLEQLLQEERRQQGMRLLKLATEKQQEAIRAYYEAGENMTKAAKHLGISRQTCDQRVHSGMERIRKKCKKEDCL